MVEARNLYQFIETTAFTKRLNALASGELLTVIQDDLRRDPTRWPVMQGTGGARKGRAADPLAGKGKSGSFRYIYLYLAHAGRIYLLFIFAKDEQANLTAAQKQEVARLCAAIRRELQ